MKMLAAGGLPPLTDGIREADADNPGGYYEFEKVKQLKKDTTWLESARGKAVKVISQLLDQLPLHRPYKIVFALRKMDEILASQRTMLARRGQPCDRVSDAEMADAFGRHLRAVQQWLAEHSQMEGALCRLRCCLARPACYEPRDQDLSRTPLRCTANG